MHVSGGALPSYVVCRRAQQGHQPEAGARGAEACLAMWDVGARLKAKPKPRPKPQGHQPEAGTRGAEACLAMCDVGACLNPKPKTKPQI